MSKQLIYLAEDRETLNGFSILRRDFIFANESLHERLLRQLQSLQEKYNFEIVKIKQDQKSPESNHPLSRIFDATLVFFDHIAYSDGLIEKMIANDFYYNSHSINKFRTHFNHTIASESDHQAYVHFPYENELGQKIENAKIFSIPLKLPVGIYPDKNYEVALMDYFYQPLHDSKDILKIQSCLARESTAKIVKSLKFIFSNSWIEKIMNNSFLAKFSNKIGSNCKIHSSAVLESCIIGDNVEIGPHCFLRGAIIGDDVIIREKCSIKVSVIGKGSYIVPTDIFNCYIGEYCNIVTHILYHSVIGAHTFVGGGVGFADFKFNAEAIGADDQIFFGGVVGNGSFIGAGLLFQAGVEIPNDTKLINYNQIGSGHFKAGQIYVAKGAQITHIPKSFLPDNKNATSKKVEPQL
jgi:acetyltransferase-like isoleucine patch superfamily enzyme